MTTSISMSYQSQKHTCLHSLWHWTFYWDYLTNWNHRCCHPGWVRNSNLYYFVTNWYQESDTISDTMTIIMMRVCCHVCMIATLWSDICGQTSVHLKWQCYQYQWNLILVTIIMFYWNDDLHIWLFRMKTNINYQIHTQFAWECLCSVKQKENKSTMPHRSHRRLS